MKKYKLLFLTATMILTACQAQAMPVLNREQNTRHFGVELRSADLGYHRLQSCPALTALLQNNSRNDEYTRVRIILKNENDTIVHVSDMKYDVPPSADKPFIVYNNHPYCSTQLEPGSYSYSVELYKRFSSKPSRVYEDVADFYK